MRKWSLQEVTLSNFLEPLIQSEVGLWEASGEAGAAKPGSGPRSHSEQCEGSGEWTHGLSHSDPLFPFYVFAFIPHAVILKMKWTESRRSLRCFFIFLFETKHTSDSEETVCIFHFLVAWRSLPDARGEWILGAVERKCPVCLSKTVTGMLSVGLYVTCKCEARAGH